MAQIDALNRIEHRGRLSGFANMLRKESSNWIGTHRWWLQAFIWLAILNGFMLFLQHVMPNMATPDGQPVMEQDPNVSALQFFFSAGSMALAIGIIILTQGLIIDEKQSGMAEWVLSKPIARTTFVLAKLVASVLGIAVLMLGLPSLLGYLQINLVESAITTPTNFALGVATLSLMLFFFLTLTVMMGVVAESRAAVLGAGLGLLLGGQMVLEIFPALMEYTPFALPSLAQLVAMGLPLPDWSWQPYVVTAASSVAFTAMALWRFERLEF